MEGSFPIPCHINMMNVNFLLKGSLSILYKSYHIKRNNKNDEASYWIFSIISKTNSHENIHKFSSNFWPKHIFNTIFKIAFLSKICCQKMFFGWSSYIYIYIHTHTHTSLITCALHIQWSLFLFFVLGLVS